MLPGDTLDLTVSYMEQVYDPDLLESNARDALDGVHFDTLVGTGLSGALAIPPLARALGVNFLIVRKPGDGTHSWLDFEGHLGRGWVFVDDFFASGRTFRRVHDKVTQVSFSKAFETTFQGAFLYNAIRPFRSPDCEDIQRYLTTEYEVPNLTPYE
ncbi:hypothetical protein N806_29710 [Rhodococcus sp. P27]|nr:hypothetical protein N806_29710 [Rhodococcus sp. P27]